MKQYRKPISIRPAEVARDKTSLVYFLLNIAKYTYSFTRVLLVSVFFAGISVVVGVYSYRIYESNPNTIIDVMDAIFKEPFPDTETVKFTALSSLILAVIFFVEYVVTQKKQTKNTSGLVKLIAGITIIIWVDIQAFKLDFYQLFIRLEKYPDLLFEVIVSQVISVFAVVLMTPLFKKMLSFPPFALDFPAVDEKFAKYVNHIKYYVTSLLLIGIITYLSTITINDETYFYNSFQIPIVQSGAFLLATGFSVFFNYPTENLGLPRLFSFTRFLVGFLCVLGVGFFYSQFSNPEIYLVAMVVSFLLSWLSISVAILLY